MHDHHRLGGLAGRIRDDIVERLAEIKLPGVELGPAGVVGRVVTAQANFAPAATQVDVGITAEGEALGAVTGLCGSGFYDLLLTIHCSLSFGGFLHEKDECGEDPGRPGD